MVEVRTQVRVAVRLQLDARLLGRSLGHLYAPYLPTQKIHFAADPIPDPTVTISQHSVAPSEGRGALSDGPLHASIPFQVSVGAPMSRAV